MTIAAGTGCPGLLVYDRASTERNLSRRDQVHAFFHRNPLADWWNDAGCFSKIARVDAGVLQGIFKSPDVFFVNTHAFCQEERNRNDCQAGLFVKTISCKTEAVSCGKIHRFLRVFSQSDVQLLSSEKRLFGTIF
jgi:hypothetical protein